MARRLLRVVSILALAAGIASCSPTDHRAVLATLRHDLAHQYHECVPLGWNPVPITGTYYPGANVEIQEQGNGQVWLPAMWLAWVDGAQMRKRADVRASYELMHDLARIGMLEEEQRGAAGSKFRLTPRAVPYFYADDEHGNNKGAYSYLCYSTVVPAEVVANEPVHTEDVPGIGKTDVFRARFTWTPSDPAPWANDPLIRSRSVVLSPLHRVVTAEIVYAGDRWTVAGLTSERSSLPQVVDASAWPHARF